MTAATHNKLISFIWSIADDCLRDVYVRGKYRDVILPMVVLRRLDVLLEKTKDDVLKEFKYQKEKQYTKLDKGALEDASAYSFYNTSPWTLQKLHDTATNNLQSLEANFIDYLLGFSENVKDIIAKFNFFDQVKSMSDKKVLINVLEKFISPHINLSPLETEDPDGRKLAPLSNLGMGYVFEELIRKFNEENNEEAGEHFTPREVIELMSHIIFDPVKDKLPPVITVYDPACGSGGMLTEAQNFITDQDGQIKAQATVLLHGIEINDETYAICKADMLIKGEQEEDSGDLKNIINGSTLSEDHFRRRTFDFMLSNPPYGKSWVNDQGYIRADGKEVTDPRYLVRLPDYWDEDEIVEAVPRTSDGQLLFLMEMVSKMKPLAPNQLQGSRIASIHNGSSLFTGDAGSGESNIRRHIIENDLLDCIIQLPNNLFYNTGISTYLWVLTNSKSSERRGQVQLIDASQSYRKLRRNLGAKNCEFAPEHIQEILEAYRDRKVSERINEGDLAAQVFDNDDFGYYKVSIERPKRLKAQFSPELIAPLHFDDKLEQPMQWAWQEFGEEVYQNVSQFKTDLEKWLKEHEPELSKKLCNAFLNQKLWTKHHRLFNAAQQLMKIIGQEEFMDFNAFRQLVKNTIKETPALKEMKLKSPEINTLLNAVSSYDAKAEKVIKSEYMVFYDEVERLLENLDCKKEDLGDFGYYQKEGNIFIQYETESNLRDYENIPLKEDIHAYFLREVKPHVKEAWINLGATKIGYEISFNKYFYQYKPLRSLEEVTTDLRQLDAQSHGLIEGILKLGL